MVCDAIRYQNHPESAMKSKMALLVHLATHALRSYGICDGPVNSLYSNDLSKLGLTQNQLESVIVDIASCIADISESAKQFNHAA